ncbi:MAG TPA: isocitrate/isopropylmalate dehydrogenase family protein [Candidatus Omnitrophota bacterium]|nr:isocitrate/isopropylmalate dehydrogenase family protein [Candidatus Omnitrophota bacterium]HPD83935.1 isocitrate/isopropylmalate dehydrogenase family protein [Candidatus Omnitrophota bacterium]HRZ02792.1 isocitrate/isopropylmalate dehydrogenase family protein [Candidatus Omnitrophota bacterium]
MYRVTLIPGDGIGPEVAEAMKQCIEKTGVKIQWDEQPAGEHAIAQYGTPLPERVLESIRKNKVAIKGPIVTPIGKGFRSVNVQLRQALDLFACVRPAKYYEGTKSIVKDIDLVIVRENTEDLYAGVEFDLGTPQTQELIKMINRLQPKQVREDSAITIKPISAFASERIIRYAFEYALKNNRKKVTAVHKANIMKFTDGLFLKTAQKIAEEYRGRINFEDVIVDNMCMQLVQRASFFDVLVLPNLYGDIVSDLCAGLIGGLGIAPGANIGDEIALFEPVHGSAPKYTGKNKVNPTATILSGVLMLRHIKENKAADRLESAVREVIKEGKFVTYDLKVNRDDPSAVGTREMADAICRKLG